MKKINKIKSIVVIIILVFALIYLLSNRTKNVFEEIYYSECPSIFKGGITNSSLADVKGFYRADRDMEKDLGGLIIYIMKENEAISRWVDIEKDNQMMVKSWIKDSDYIITLHYKYELETNKLYVKCYLENIQSEKEVQNSEEVLPQFLAEQGIDATTLEEVSDIMLEEFLRQWFEGNSMSKFSMDDLGDFEIVYE